MLHKIYATIRFFKYNIHPQRMEFKARKTVLFGANKAFRFFRDKTFRSLLSFEKKDKEEQNRIFNELTVTNLILLILMLDQKVQEAKKEDEKTYIRALREKVPEYFKNFMRRIGIPENYVKLWEGLIDMRHNEYVDDIRDMRGEFLNQNDELLQECALDNRVMLFQTIALGLYSHLMRGKIKKDDQIYRHLQPYLLRVYKGYLKRI